MFLDYKISAQKGSQEISPVDLALKKYKECVRNAPNGSTVVPTHPTVVPTDIGPIQRPFTIAPTLSKGGTLAEYALNAYRETTLIICKFPPK